MLDSCKYHNKRDGVCYPLTDARGIFCAYVCDKCYDEKKSKYRPSIFEDSNYDSWGERIEEDNW